jgi:hypothetical protein
MTLPAKNTTSTSNAARFASLEAQVGAISTTLEDFVTESKEYRLRAERNESQIWAAIKEQGDNLNRAVERLSNNGRISWGMIVSTGGFILALVGAGAAVNHAMNEARIKQVEIRQEFMAKELDRHYEDLRARK